jgi:hypothetical protein
MPRHVDILRAALLLFLVLAGPGLALATEPLSDEDLDQVSAMGEFSLQLGEGPNGIPSVNFGFQTGSTSGNGSVLISPTPTPSSVINGNVNFSNTLFHVDNMIFNLNICVQCHATTLTQGNLGVPITVKLVP